MNRRGNFGGTSGGPVIPFSLPGPGTSLELAATNDARDLAVSGFTGDDIDYSLYSSYSGPIFIPDYSRLGAVVWCCKGGHQHPDFTGAIAFDFTDLTHKMHEHANGGTRYSPTDKWFDLATESTGADFYEITGNGVPCPGHGYQNNSYLPASLGGGSKGSVLVVGRTAMGAGGTTTSKSVYAFNLSTNVWSRVTNNLATRAGNETGVVYDAARGRYWYLTRDGSENDSFIPYLRLSDWTWQTDAAWSGFPPGELGGAGRAWLYSSKLFLQTGGATPALLGFDPDVPTNVPAFVTISGSAGSTLPNNFNMFVYYPRTGKFYYTTKDGGTTLNRLTPPGDPLGGTWTHDTVTISPGLTGGTWIGDGSHLTQHYTGLQYIPSPVNRLAWFPGGTNPPQLLDPT